MTNLSHFGLYFLSLLNADNFLSDTWFCVFYFVGWWLFLHFYKYSWLFLASICYLAFWSTWVLFLWLVSQDESHVYTRDNYLSLIRKVPFEYSTQLQDWGFPIWLAERGNILSTLWSLGNLPHPFMWFIPWLKVCSSYICADKYQSDPMNILGMLSLCRSLVLLYGLNIPWGQ